MQNRFAKKQEPNIKRPGDDPLDDSSISGQIGNQLNKVGQQFTDQVKGMVKASPGKSLLIALAAGIAIGWMVRKS